MSDYGDLVARLRDPKADLWNILTEAADAIEALQADAEAGARDALRELVDALEAEAGAKMTADNALENFSHPDAELRAHEKAMIRAHEAMKAARAALAASAPVGKTIMCSDCSETWIEGEPEKHAPNCQRNTPADDLVARLPNAQTVECHPAATLEWCREAADAIEALRAEVKPRADKCGVKLSPTLCSDCPARWCRGESSVAQDDLAAILRAVGLSDAARPYSPHEVVQRDLLPRIEALHMEQTMTDAEIIAIRDAHLPAQGEPFDCLAFARAVLRAAYKEPPISAFHSDVPPVDEPRKWEEGERDFALDPHFESVVRLENEQTISLVPRLRETADGFRRYGDELKAVELEREAAAVEALRAEVGRLKDAPDDPLFILRLDHAKHLLKRWLQITNLAKRGDATVSTWDAMRRETDAWLTQDRNFDKGDHA